MRYQPTPGPGPTLILLWCRRVNPGSSDGRREEGAQLLPKNQAEGFGGGGEYERVDGECWKGVAERGRGDGRATLVRCALTKQNSVKRRKVESAEPYAR